MRSGEENQTVTMVTKKIRTEYMKKFRDPRWETFSKCYEDSLKYRLTRRVMEHSHKPWFWEGWDGGSDSSGWSTPRLTRNKIAPLSLPAARASSPETKPSEDGQAERDSGQKGGGAGENGVTEGGGAAALDASGPSEETTHDAPADTTSSDGEQVNSVPKRRPRRRGLRSELGCQDSSHDDKPAAVRKPPRAKSQPPISTKETLRASSRLDWTEGQTEAKRGSAAERRRARSADLEKTRRPRLAAADDRWMTEYMRCFSARLR